MKGGTSGYGFSKRDVRGWLFVGSLSVSALDLVPEFLRLEA